VTAAVHPLRRICVFCGSNRGADPAFAAAAELTGRELVRRGIGLVYGGGNIGLMGVLADAVLQAGGHVTGVIPETLMAREVGHRGLPDLRVVQTMHERKAIMAELADGFIALPGGFGTFDETFEILTWAQLGLHAKPCALLNVNGFFDPLLRFLDHAVAERFLRAGHRSLILVHSDINTLLDRMSAHHPKPERKWIDEKNL
jgi:uncharacterized protein (TIGR00730 family)